MFNKILKTLNKNLLQMKNSSHELDQSTCYQADKIFICGQDCSLMNILT